MRYSEQLENKLNKMYKEKLNPTQKKMGVIKKYTKTFSDKVGEKKAVFYYKIAEEGQPFFSNAVKTNVVINYSDDINYEYIHKELMPGEIVATTCGFNSYNDFVDKQSNLNNADLNRILIMIQSLIPITEEEYKSIQ